MKKSLLMMAGILALFSFIIIGPVGSGSNGPITTYEHGAGF
ncbi:hypothetical protein M2109_003208 [Paenibacillus sp. PastH-3]|jgi:hypothetical protein|nr:hypothetical protein [Paenibacillus sp. PastH-4]MDH6444997.1 hypothetical protein [Paenibacillus sp. PastF-4]MDH6528890.1 hypothetical protein [Paenibacillus sp. PastH-3]